jgi:hypothetical protein
LIVRVIEPTIATSAQRAESLRPSLPSALVASNERSTALAHAPKEVTTSTTFAGSNGNFNE